MIGSLLAWAASKGVPAGAVKAGAALLLLAAIVTGVTLWFARHDRAVLEQNDAKIAVQVEKSARRADQNMQRRIDARQADAVARRREFDNASSSIPHEGLTRRQRLDLCIELRDAGEDTAVIPECCDLHPGGTSCAVGGHLTQ